MSLNAISENKILTKISEFTEVMIHSGSFYLGLHNLKVFSSEELKTLGFLAFIGR